MKRRYILPMPGSSIFLVEALGSTLGIRMGGASGQSGASRSDPCNNLMSVSLLLMNPLPTSREIACWRHA